LFEWLLHLVTTAGLIINPAAGKGTARRRLHGITQSFAARGVQQVRQTAAPGDEERVTREALDAGWNTIVAVGGDGTCSRIADTILRSGARCALTVVPAGTGNDFAKTVGLADYSGDQIAELVIGGTTTRIDVGLADERYFINSCGFGFDASVLEATERVKYLKGDALYIYAALAQLFTYRGLPVLVDGAGSTTARELLMATVSNGRFLGGAFRIAPDASVTDGELDVCLIGNAGVLQRIRLFAAAMRGTHRRFEAVQMFKSSSLGFKFAAPPWVELDGELRQGRSNEVRISCVPRALEVIAAPVAAL
jgi:diacylglycerol kinase (ATP)